MSKTTTIYGIYDPHTRNVVYVGQTDGELISRLHDHTYSGSNGRLSEWIKALRKSGNKPIISAIEIVDVSRGTERENYWIEKYRGIGLKLFNSHKVNNYKGQIRKPIINGIQPTSLKISPELKARLIKKASKQKITLHAFIINLLKMAV